MAKIMVVSTGGNGSTRYSIFDSTGKKIITDKPLSDVAETISRDYLKIAQKVSIATRTLEAHNVKEIDLSKLGSDARFQLTQKIAEIVK